MVLDTAEVLVQGSWETLEFLDLTTRNANLHWLAKALGIYKNTTAAMLWRLPIMAEIMAARDARIMARDDTRRSRKKALCPQILDVNVRDYALEVDKSKRKCIIYIQEQETLQFLVGQLFKDLREGQVVDKPRPTKPRTATTTAWTL